MAQVKKEAVREAILAAAYRLFRRKGYIDTTLNEIAAAAGTSRANIYVYFRSKFVLFYAVFEPWLQRRLKTLEAELRRVPAPRARLRRILTALWRDIPSEANGFANNLMQALSTASAADRYSPTLLRSVENRVAAMIEGCIAPARRGRIDTRALAHLSFMAFDGFAMHAHLRTREVCSDTIIDTMCAMLLRSSDGAGTVRPSPR